MSAYKSIIISANGIASSFVECVQGVAYKQPRRIGFDLAVDEKICYTLPLNDRNTAASVILFGKLEGCLEGSAHDTASHGSDECCSEAKCHFDDRNCRIALCAKHMICWNPKVGISGVRTTSAGMAH
ncbi:hypothetical protein HG531_007180 [Fusarium graminearum]|nr:hypothetical protein HG531_007180 [Fusarium graminearum]